MSAALRRERGDVDAAIKMRVEEMPQIAEMALEYLASTMRYTNTRGVQRAQPTWQALTHFLITKPTIGASDNAVNTGGQGRWRYRFDCIGMHLTIIFIAVQAVL